MKTKHLMKLTLSVCAVGLFAGCATKSVVKSDGTTNEPVFPDPYSLTFDNNRGTFPTADELANIKSGMTKDQLYKLIGRPHYDEGMVSVREWDYLFHFHTPGQGTNDVTTCQYKVIFDKDRYARSFFWKAVDPAEGVCPPGNNPKAPKRYTLSADALFTFDKGDLAHMNPKGRAQLDELAYKIKSFDQLRGLRVVGHTDYLGNDDYNQRLSQQRAQTVRLYLIERGIDAGLITAVGMGERQPVKQCNSTGNRSALIECLQPNRRVEVEVDGSGIVQE